MRRLGLCTLVVVCLWPSGEGWSQETQPIDRTVAYEGHLELDGQPQHGSFDFRVGLFGNDSADTSCLAQETMPDDCGLWHMEYAAVDVYAGAFNVSLGPLPTAIVQRRDLYLAIAVRTAGEGTFVALQGVQKLHPTLHAVRSDFGVVPVGSIIAWHPNLNPGLLTLPPEWVRCDGQVLNDPDSPLNGVIIPNLNSAGRFLRGGTSSGTLQEDQIQTHTHIDSGHRHTYFTTAWFFNELVNGSNYLRGTDTTSGRHQDRSQTSQANLGEPTPFEQSSDIRHGDETRPRNMSVVWIMRIK